MRFPLIWFSCLVILFVSSCATRDDDSYPSCCTTLPLGEIANNLGFKMEDRGMHQYHFYNGKYEFDLLASAGAVALADESSFRRSKFTPIWTMKGDVTAEEVESKIRIYLYGKK